ncbi:MAG TPA: DUF2846 domain-containing protein, partial [Flavisolibacter sp.]|nr:DUF2846 domain-containing protein [Flavisolibacter sp.]
TTNNNGMRLKYFLFNTFFVTAFALTTVYSQQLPNDRKAIVYVYRSSMWSGAYGYKLRQGDSTLYKIKFKSFYVMKLNEGTHYFWAKTIGRTDLTLTVEAGKSYFVKCGIKGFIPKPKMILLSDEQAKKEASKGYLKRKLKENNLKL